MPRAESGMVRREVIPAAMASWIQGMAAESVLSSGVRRMPPEVQSATKKEPHTALMRVSVLAASPDVAWSSARTRKVPAGVLSSTHPRSRATTARATRSSKSEQSTSASPRGWPATSNAQNHFTCAAAG